MWKNLPYASDNNSVVGAYYRWPTGRAGPAWPDVVPCRLDGGLASTGHRAYHAMPPRASCLAYDPWHGPWAVWPCCAARWARPFFPCRAGPQPDNQKTSHFHQIFTECLNHFFIITSFEQDSIIFITIFTKSHRFTFTFTTVPHNHESQHKRKDKETRLYENDDQKELFCVMLPQI